MGRHWAANYGVRRNKKPLKNICLKVDLVSPHLFPNPLPREERYKGLVPILYVKAQGREIWGHMGVTPISTFKDMISEKQWRKFTQGDREFIIQRRENKRNK